MPASRCATATDAAPGNPLGDEAMVLRLYDPDRRPPNWSDLVASGQFVAFSSDADSGAATDATGGVYASPELATCLVFESLAAARRFCEAQVTDIESVRFEVFDARGRVEPPLLVIVSAARAASLEGNPGGIQRRAWASVVLLLCAAPLIWYDYATSGGALVLPTFLGISMALAALRLLFMNAAVREVERTRRKRLERYE